MRSVLISIQPKWCELIANGSKTIEVRKTKPKLETPFKAYIYCTKGNVSEGLVVGGDAKLIKCTNYNRAIPVGGYIGNGKVIGEFVCEVILPISVYYSDQNSRAALREGPFTCLTDKEIMDYLGNGNTGYGWTISNLVIYDKPKELGEFIVPSKIGCCNEGKCRGCKYLDRGNGFNVEDDCNAKFNTDEYKPLRKAPQSWCYVEEADNV